jgi:putative membrane protein insertion efficiency factor
MLTRWIVKLIRFYQKWISPAWGRRCRFVPSCSEYAAEAVSKKGWAGLWLSFLRLLKCHPFHPGGYDPVG